MIVNKKTIEKKPRRTNIIRKVYGGKRKNINHDERNYKLFKYHKKVS